MIASGAADVMRTASIGMGIVHEIARGLTTAINMLKTMGEDHRILVSAVLMSLCALGAYAWATADPPVDRDGEGYYSPWTARTSRGLGFDHSERTDALSPLTLLRQPGASSDAAELFPAPERQNGVRLVARRR